MKQRLSGELTPAVDYELALDLMAARILARHGDSGRYVGLTMSGSAARALRRLITLN